MTTSRTATGTHPGTDTDWAEHAAGLVAELSETGDLHDPAWAAALAATARHVLVPTAFTQGSDGSWTVLDTANNLALTYSPTTLVTAIGNGLGVSSSTKPDLMVRMLEILDVHPGQRVLEIGTGTGYNAALLSHRLGADHVFSIDVDTDLVELARARLGRIGHRPALAVRDGRGGWPEHGPYDRIIATCSVPAVPWSWASQLRVGGLVLVDLKLGAAAGNLVALRRYPDRLEGRFTRRWAAFMAMRHHGEVPPVRVEPAQGTTARLTRAPGEPWRSHREVWMLATQTLPVGVTHGYTLDPHTGRPGAATLSAPDGSWAHVQLQAAHNTQTHSRPRGGGEVGELSYREMTEAGPSRLWCHVEAAYQRWCRWNRPSWERFGLTVSAHVHTLWLDTPRHRLPGLA